MPASHSAQGQRSDLDSGDELWNQALRHSFGATLVPLSRDAEAPTIITYAVPMGLIDVHWRGVSWRFETAKLTDKLTNQLDPEIQVRLVRRSANSSNRPGTGTQYDATGGTGEGGQWLFVVRPGHSHSHSPSLTCVATVSLCA